MMDGFVSFEATASDSERESLNDSNALKTSIYYPVLIISEMDHRFTPTNLDLMKAL